MVARLVLLGGVLSVGLMLAGLVAIERHGVDGHPVESARIVENRESGRSVDVFVSVGQLAPALSRWPPDPVAVMTVGVLVLLVTPALGLAAALVGFIRDRDRVYAVISMLLIVVLAWALTLRVGG
jgi:uncharacterized membrane protein